MAGVEDDPLEKFKSNFQLVMTGKEMHGRGEPTTYHLKLRSKPTPIEPNPIWCDVTVNEGDYESAIHDWALETSQFLDVPGTKVHEANFIKKVIRIWHEREDDYDNDDDQVVPKKRLFVKKPMVIKIENLIVYVSAEDRVLKLDYIVGRASPVTPAELDVAIKYYGDKVKFSQVISNEKYFTNKIQFTEDRIGSQIRVFGNMNSDENLTFTTDIRSTAKFLFDVVKFMNRCQAEEDQSSVFAFTLMICRTKLYEFLDRNQKLGILQTLTQNTGKSFLLTLCGLILDGDFSELIIGFSRFNIRNELSKSGNIWLVDEPTATDPFDELIKSNWSKSHGKIGNVKTECTQSQRSSSIVAVNASVKQLNKEYKLSVPTLSKVAFLHIGENRVEKINPDGFRTDLDACRDAAILLHPHVAPMLAATLFLCNSRVTEEEMKKLSPYCDGDERLTESVALFYRWWNFWVNVAEEYDLELPPLLHRPFDPRCFTFYKQQLSELQPKNLDDRVELILTKPEADVIIRKKGNKGPPGYVIKTKVLEELAWFEPWMMDQLKSLRTMQDVTNGKHSRPRLVTKKDVNMRIWDQLQSFDACTVSNLCSIERAETKAKNTQHVEKLIEHLTNKNEELFNVEELLKTLCDTPFDNEDEDPPKVNASENDVVFSYDKDVTEGEVEISIGKWSNDMKDLNLSIESDSSDSSHQIRGKYVRAPMNIRDFNDENDDSNVSTEEYNEATEDSDQETKDHSVHSNDVEIEDGDFIKETGDSNVPTGVSNEATDDSDQPTKDDSVDSNEANKDNDEKDKSDEVTRENEKVTTLVGGKPNYCENDFLQRSFKDDFSSFFDSRIERDIHSIIYGKSIEPETEDENEYDGETEDENEYDGETEDENEYDGVTRVDDVNIDDKGVKGIARNVKIKDVYRDAESLNQVSKDKDKRNKQDHANKKRKVKKRLASKSVNFTENISVNASSYEQTPVSEIPGQEELSDLIPPAGTEVFSKGNRRIPHKLSSSLTKKEKRKLLGSSKRNHLGRKIPEQEDMSDLISPTKPAEVFSTFNRASPPFPESPKSTSPNNKEKRKRSGSSKRNQDHISEDVGENKGHAGTPVAEHPQDIVLESNQTAMSNSADGSAKRKRPPFEDTEAVKVGFLCKLQNCSKTVFKDAYALKTHGKTKRHRNLVKLAQKYET